ncbi:MAG: molybdopterin-binding protein [Coriobacteriales bacterium]|nr:molybdopterin-binding protein [Coriobacteriales bacterium]
MKLSARNQLKGTVIKIERGAVSSIVTLDVSGNTVTATVSNAAVDELALELGQEAYAIIKATSVMIGVDH